jgi:hypothetical protein
MRTFGPRVELARYVVAEGERVLQGQRIDGVVHVFDIPADEESDARIHVVERGVESQVALDGIIVDYVARSVQYDRPAMSVNVLDENQPDDDGGDVGGLAA